MSISIQNNLRIIDEINSKLIDKFNFCISLEGFNELLIDLDTVLDVDVDSIIALNKETLFWYDYLSDLINCLYFYKDQFSNVSEIYKYLLCFKKKENDLFLEEIQKYKIDCKDIEDGKIKVANNKSEVDICIGKMNIIISSLESYKKYIYYHYYRTNRLILKNNKDVYFLNY